MMKLPTFLLPDPSCVPLENYRIDEKEGCIRLTLCSVQTTVACPVCQQTTQRVHSLYTRRFADLPWAGIPVQIELWVRRYFCDNAACPRQIFAERIPAVSAPWSRRTNRLALAQQQIGLALGGAAGARLSPHLAMAGGTDLFLRTIRQVEMPERPTPRVLGVDDWAQRKGQVYGTILVDLETHQPIDLLADRSAETLANWLQEHPGVEIISRDRANDYAEGASRGAPDAIQVADRFHLLQNVREILQRLLERHQEALRAATAESDTAETVSPMPEAQPIHSANAPEDPPKAETAPVPTQAEKYREMRQAQRIARYNKARELHAAGMSQRQIVRHMGISIRTVRRFVMADQFPQRATRRKVPSKLDPFVPYLQEQLEGGHDNAMQLWRKLRDQYGYTGSRPLVSRWVAHHRHLCPEPPPNQAKPRRRGKPPSPNPPKPKQRVLSARQAAWLLVRSPEDLEEDDSELVERLCQHCADVRVAHSLTQEFCRMVYERSATLFDDWLSRTDATSIPELQSFAAGLQRDKAAVIAALSLPYSNGQVEGQVNRLKLIKRTMYGRANFDLLRQRVLAA